MKMYDGRVIFVYSEIPFNKQGNILLTVFGSFGIYADEPM